MERSLHVLRQFRFINDETAALVVKIYSREDWDDCIFPILRDDMFKVTRITSRPYRFMPCIESHLHLSMGCAIENV